MCRLVSTNDKTLHFASFEHLLLYLLLYIWPSMEELPNNVYLSDNFFERTPHIVGELSIIQKIIELALPIVKS